MLLISRIVLLLSFSFTGTQAWAQTLQSYLDAAHANNPVLQTNENLAAIAGLEVDKARGTYQLPNINATGNFLYAPVVQGVGYENAITNGALYSGQLNVNMPLLTRPNVEAQVKNSLVSQQLYRQNTALSQHDLARQVTGQYILTWQNLERIATTQRLLDLLTEQEKVVRVFAQNAILSQSDVLFFTIEKENQQLALRDFQIAYRQGLAALNLLCGKVDTAYTELQQPAIFLKTDTVGLSNFLKSYQLDSLLAASNQEISELKYRPQVSAFANYGLNAIMLKDIYKKFGFSAGVNFSLTIFDGHQRSLTRQQTQLSQMTSQVQREYQARQVGQQRLAAMQQIELLDAKIAAVQRQLSDYETLLKFYRERIAQGELSVNDYMNTIKSFAAVQADFTSLKTSRLLLVNDYNYWNW
jgi:outer membrane protein TolC